MTRGYRWAVLFIVASSSISLAAADPQSQAFRYRGSGYGYFNVGACQHAYTIVGVGGGGEAFLWKGLTLGVEGGYQRFINDVGFGEAYVPVGYHFVDRDRPAKWDPFVSVAPLGVYGGRNNINLAGHVGGGVTYWFKDRLGLRMEFRSHVFSGPEITAQARVGISFR
jgi:hypothetical protein